MIQMMPKKILIVEDERAIATAIQKLLEPENWEVVIAETAQEARDVLNKQTIDLCITDLALPGESGLEFFKHIRSSDRLCELPVIVLSAFAAMAQKELIVLNPVRVFKKPFPFDEFLSTIRECLEGSSGSM